MASTVEQKKQVAATTETPDATNCSLAHGISRVTSLFLVDVWRTFGRLRLPEFLRDPMHEKTKHTTPRDGPELDLSYFLFNCTLDANWNKANCQDKHDLFFKNKTMHVMHVWKNAPKCQQRKNICQNFSTDKLLACLSSKMMNWWIASSFDT